MIIADDLSLSQLSDENLFVKRDSKTEAAKKFKTLFQNNEVIFP